MTERYSAKGFVLQLEIASAFVDVGGVSRLDFPDADVQFFDGTSLESGTALKDGEPTGYVAPGTVSGDLFLDPNDSTHEAILGLLSAPEKRDWNIESDNEDLADFACAFNGTLKKCTPSAAVGDGLKASFEIKLADLATYSFAV